MPSLVKFDRITFSFGTFSQNRIQLLSENKERLSRAIRLEKKIYAYTCGSPEKLLLSTWSNAIKNNPEASLEVSC
ncbi:MAG: hypothetical protein BWZ06_01591 [Bacteroidetes bacterium ADurb.BinA261]|jgi:hypothetical protein|nr:MAG: hypothetical protein BWZ06_01591 [Bacteroidetes bacterium ADurb.BinA261]